MTTTISFRDVEQLSAYLDGQLSQAESARLESRLKADSSLSAALEDLRLTRALLRRTPQRRAPRNFSLTPKTAGIRPPVPRLVPAFRFASAVATLFLLLTFVGNLIGSFSLAAAPKMVAEPMYGIGGGAPETGPEMGSVGIEENAYLEATPTSEAAIIPAVEAPPPSDARVMATPTAIPTPTAPAEQPPAEMIAEPAVEPAVPVLIPSPLQIGLLALAVALGGTALFIHRLNERAFHRRVRKERGEK